MQSETKKRIGILRGGSGRHYHSSLKRGGEIISHILENLSDKYKTLDILVDKDYIWHLNGLPINPSDLVHKVDIVWNTSHHSLSNILESLSVPVIGPTSFLHSMEGHIPSSKKMLSEHMKSIGVKIPRSLVLPLYQEDFDESVEKYIIKNAKQVFEKFGAPWIVKSYTEDASMGIHVAKTFPELVRAIEDGVLHEKALLVEEMISGKVASLHSVSGFRDQDIYTFPIGAMFGVFSQQEKDKLTRLTQDLYRHINARHYLKVDYILDSKGNVYLLNIDSNPDLKPGSHFREACELVGAKIHDVVDHILAKLA